MMIATERGFCVEGKGKTEEDLALKGRHDERVAMILSMELRLV